jgi:Ca2+-binding RTX toxin-like protein
MLDVNNPQDIQYLATTATGFAPVHFKQGLDGYLYYADLVTGSIGRLQITPSATLHYDNTAVAEELTGATNRDVFVIDDVSTNYSADATDNNLGVVVYSGQKYDILFGFEEIRFNDKSVLVDAIPGVTINGTSANDYISASVSVRGQPKSTNLADVIRAGSGNDRVTANGGNDTVYGQAGNDSLRGLGGKDNLSGGSGNDTIEGGEGNDRIWGGSGDDILRGGNGNDVFYVSAGRDRVFGEGGADQFVFNATISATSGITSISGFQSGADVIVLENAIFRAFAGQEGTLDDGAFVDGAFADTAARRIIYNSDTGALSYDSNGRAAGGVIQIAYLNKNLDLTHADFLIV